MGKVDPNLQGPSHEAGKPGVKGAAMKEMPARSVDR